MSLYVGVMSGTSMDAVDAVLAEVNDAGATVVHQHATAIAQPLRTRLEAALRSEALAALEAWRLDAEVGALFATAVLELLAAADTPPARVSAVGSHGQTLYHAPDADPPLTVQLGDPNVIAWRTGITTVSDFRRMDLAAGGQGAPLAPGFHAHAFAAADRPRAVVNLGGIANVTVLPPRGRGAVRGFDTGPANTLMDLWCARTRGDPFDAGGAWAATGRVDAPLLEVLLDEPYFSRKPPKSTGRELFNGSWLDARLRGVAAVPPEDVQRTLCELTAITVAAALDRHGDGAKEVYVCGGGALNPVLMDALSGALPGRIVQTTASLGVAPKAVEGTAFAWMAHERLAGRSAALPSVTGATRPVLLGGVYRRD